MRGGPVAFGTRLDGKKDYASLGAPDTVNAINLNGEALINLLTRVFTYEITATDPTGTEEEKKSKPWMNFDFGMEEELKSERADWTNLTFYCGVTRLDNLYLSNKSYISKESFARNRGYETLATKYGLSVTNNHYRTLYVIILANYEVNSLTKPIFVVPEG